jgi:hypothetical protein
VDQLALPYRIGLAALLVLVLAWFTVLRPKDNTGNAPLPAAKPAAAKNLAPGVAGLSGAVDKAKGAVATSQSSAKATEAAVAQAGSATTAVTTAVTGQVPAPAATTATKPATRVAATVQGDPSAKILGELAQGKVAIVLFSSLRGSEDAHVRAVLHRLNRHHGRVTVHSAPISAVGSYEAITRGIQVVQAPTLLVIGPQRKAHRIVGFTDRAEVQQLVDDVGRFN